MTLSVAVVGHGAGLDGAGLGPVIDACGLVLRMHDAWWQRSPNNLAGDSAAALRADFGARWDFGILPGSWGEALWREDYRPAMGRPRFGWWCYGYRDRGLAQRRSFDGLPLLTVDVTDTTTILLRPGMARAAPTRGLAAALMALLLLPKLRRLALFGCERLRDGRLDGTGYSRRYMAASPRAAAQEAGGRSGVVSGPHHFEAERDLLRARAEEARCTLEFYPGEWGVDSIPSCRAATRLDGGADTAALRDA